MRNGTPAVNAIQARSFSSWVSSGARCGRNAAISQNRLPTRNSVGPPAAQLITQYRRIGVEWFIRRICMAINIRTGISPAPNQLNRIMLYCTRDVLSR